MPDLLILFSIWMKLLSFDIVNFGFPQSLENMVYDFMSFKLFSSGYKHVSSTYWAISPHARMGGRLLNWSEHPSMRIRTDDKNNTNEFFWQKIQIKCTC